jgi:biopolymer transport protein ExbD
MAEMDTSSGGGHKKSPGVKKSKKLSTRVDLTPMVDLGFLLITFFIFTTTMADPKVMKLNTPDKSDLNDNTLVVDTYTMNLLLGRNDKIYSHIGQLRPDASNVVLYDYNNIREGLIKFRQSVPIADTAFMNVIIKPSDSATFKNTIDIIDEMTINDLKKYAKVDMSKEEYELTEKLAIMMAGQPSAPPANK